jgi:hypothetical protein
MKNASIFTIVALFTISMNSFGAETTTPVVNDTIKAKVMGQLKESIDRLQRCLTGKCTKVEALKAARDVSITAAAAVAALYGIGTALQKSRSYLPKDLRYPAYKTGEYMKKPVTSTVRAGKKAAGAMVEGVEKVMNPYQDTHAEEGHSFNSNVSPDRIEMVQE